MSQDNYIYKEKRPWGSFYIIAEEESYKIKKIEVNSGHRLSYQLHKKRSEVWTIINGNGKILLDDIEYKYSPGDTFVIPKGIKHRIENNSKDKTVFIEVQTGNYFGEDDIVRLDDDYKRI
tara:strand:+ start:2090 stop:2449 length:360 start_codon:yes stop_codon:yes gene_type:complete